MARAVILDRDGVLGEKLGKGEYVESESNWRWQPRAREALRLLADAGFIVVVATNQSGVARGLVAREAVEAIHARMLREAEAAGGRIDAIYACFHGPNDGCSCRKPRPGMILEAAARFGFSPKTTPFIGDEPEVDAVAAANAGCPFILVSRERDVLDAALALTAPSEVRGGMA